MKTKILLADDETDLLEIVSSLLSDEGYECATAINGMEASKLLEKEKFDVVISDFNMPLMNGSELLFWCRKNNIHIPFIFFTGARERLPIEQMALQDCCASVIDKPFKFPHLISAIKAALERNHDYDCHDSKSGMFPGQHYKNNSQLT